MRAVRWMSIVALLVCATARADIRNPDIRDIQPEMAFAGVQNHPELVFLIHVRDKGYWGPNVEFESRVLPIPGPRPFAPGFRNTIERVTVLAVPKAAYDKLTEEDRQALSAESPGVLSCRIERPRMFVDVKDPDPAPIRYRVSVAEGELSVKPAPGDRESSRARPGRGPRAVWGLALAASVAWLGLVVGRRLVPGRS